MNNIEQGNRMI